MSCFVVPDYHIDTLVSWAVANGAGAFIGGLDPRGVAAEMHRANCTAYRERYGEDHGEGYTFTMRLEARTLPPEQIIKACDCLDYQCGDWMDYSGSIAERAVDQIRRTATYALPGYRAAAWTLEEVTA
jgi:hypothetical protein